MKNDTSVKDGFIEVKFKPLSGEEDQAGGVIWRAQDADNYYIARANALEDNVTIYHTVKGRRVLFKSMNTKVVSGVAFFAHPATRPTTYGEYSAIINAGEHHHGDQWRGGRHPTVLPAH